MKPAASTSVPRPALRRPPAWKAMAPWAVSLGAHALLVVLALVVAWRIIEPDPPPPAVAVSFEAPSYDPTLVRDEELAPPDAARAPLTRFEVAPAPPPGAGPAQADPFALPADGAAALALPAAPPALAFDRPQSFSARFAGLSASDARDIVYVVDASGSMVTSLPDVMYELKRSIRALHPTQRFQALVFRAERRADALVPVFEAAPAPGDRLALLPATADNKERVFAWLDAVRPGGASNPTAALAAALDLKPAAVFLLSSRLSAGAGGPGAQDLLAFLDRRNPVDRRSGRRRVLIRTIQVLDAEPDETLRLIAAAHGGVNGYKFISLEELQRSRAENPAPARR